MKYTEPQKCPHCKRAVSFLILVVKEKKKYYQLTRCPKADCGHYDEIRPLTAEEIEAFKKTKPRTDDPPPPDTAWGRSQGSNYEF